MEERVLLEGVANEVAGVFVKNGHGLLTNQRFIYSKHGVAKTLMIGALVNLTQGSYQYSIAYDQMREIRVDRLRLGSGLFITTKDGQEHRYGILKPTEWSIAVSNFIAYNKQPQQAAPQAPAPEAPDALSQIERLADLLEKGMITPEEYEQKKGELLRRL